MTEFVFANKSYVNTTVVQTGLENQTLEVKANRLLKLKYSRRRRKETEGREQYTI
jgi:hypothetical protein